MVKQLIRDEAKETKPWLQKMQETKKFSQQTVVGLVIKPSPNPNAEPSMYGANRSRRNIQNIGQIGEDMVRDDIEYIEVVTRYANQPVTKPNMDFPMTNGIVVKFWCGW